MNELVSIWLGLAPFFGGLTVSAFFLIVFVGLVAWFNRSGLPTVIMTIFLLFYGLKEVNPVFFSLMVLTGIIGAIFFYQGFIQITRARP